MRDYPVMIAQINHVEPAPRRVRGLLAGETIFDTTRALYVWEKPYYPYYYIPLADVGPQLVSEAAIRRTSRGLTEIFGLKVGDVHRPRAAKVVRESPIDQLAGTVRFEWNGLDAWLEEDEEVFVHPRNPYVRVDALRSTRTVRVELEGVVLGESSSPIMVFETGLPTRYYLNRTEVDFEHLIPTTTVTECPYKGTTSGWWSVRIGDVVHPDLAWSYDFPTRQLLPIAGLVAFYNERVDLFVEGRQLERPETHFFPSATR
jgi:uncharacterized protein (DUF427 family)